MRKNNMNINMDLDDCFNDYEDSLPYNNEEEYNDYMTRDLPLDDEDLIDD